MSHPDTPPAGDHELLSPDAVRRRRFDVAARGFVPDDVLSYLDELAAALARVRESSPALIQLRAAQDRLDELRTQAQAIERHLAAVTAHAEAYVEALIEEAEVELGAILDDSRRESA